MKRGESLCYLGNRVCLLCDFVSKCTLCGLSNYLYFFCMMVGVCTMYLVLLVILLDSAPAGHWYCASCKTLLQ